MKTQQINDTTIYIHGDGDKTLIFVHGWPDTHRVWDKQVAFFQEKYRCVTFSLPGFDKNWTDSAQTPPRQRPKGYSLVDILATLDSIINAVSPNDKVILVVHDWGCLFGYQYYVKHAQRIEKIVAIDVGDAAWGSKTFMRESTLLSKLMIFAYQITLAILWLVGGKIGDRLTQAMAKGLGAPQARKQIGAFMNYPYFIQWLGFLGSYGTYRQQSVPHFKCPILYCYGQKKPFMFHSKSWLEGLSSHPENKVVKMPSSHWVMIDVPEDFNAEVLAWLGR